MNILMVSGHACIRVQKISIPLLEKGHSVHHIASKLPTYYEQYDSFVRAPSVRQYINALKVYEPHTDIFHCHNEPSWFVTAIKEISDKPVILDVHDSYAARMTDNEYDTLEDAGHSPMRISHEERNNFQLADGLVFVSEPFRDVVVNEFKLTQPSLVLPSYLCDFMYEYQGIKKGWLGGLVYEGRVDLPDEAAEGTEQHGFKYCNYLDAAKQARGIGMDFHLYPGRILSAPSEEKFVNTYKDFALLHGGRSYPELLQSISRHDWGLVGNIFKTTNWDVALPNKFFEYMAAGVPVVSINAKHVSEWIEKFGIGITVQSLHELADKWKEHREVRRRMVKVRRYFVMQNHIKKLEEFYKQFI